MYKEFIQKIVTQLAWNAAELLVFGVIMMLLQIFLFSYSNQKLWDKSSLIDLGNSFILAFCTPFFLILPMGVVDKLIQLNPAVTTLSIDLANHMSLGLQVLIAVFVIDFIGYWRHRLMHTRWLWPIHSIHHCSKRMDWLANERFHVLNYLIITTITIVITQIFFGPVVVLISAFLRRFYNFLIHSNVRMDYGILGYVFVSPRFHHWHHSADATIINSNYCTFFSCIDWVFGTFHLPKGGSYPSTIGEPDHIKENLLTQFLHPFKVWGSWLFRMPK